MKENAPEILYAETDGLGNISHVHPGVWPECENIKYLRADIIDNPNHAELIYSATRRGRDGLQQELSKWLREVKARAVTRLPRNDPATIMASTAIITTIDNIIEHVESL